jgi:uncharacterized membrane protein
MVLLMFYFSGSAATRYKAGVKRAVDLEVRQGGGERDWRQVLATAGAGAALALLAVVLDGGVQPAGVSTCLDMQAAPRQALVLLAYLG